MAQGRVLSGKTLILHPKGVEILASEEKCRFSILYVLIVPQFIMAGIAVIIISGDNDLSF